MTQTCPGKFSHSQIQSIQNHCHNFEIVLKQLAVIKSEVHSLVELLNDKVTGKDVSAKAIMASIESSRSSIKLNFRQLVGPIEQATSLAQKPRVQPSLMPHFEHQTTLYYKKDLLKNAILLNQINIPLKINRMNTDVSGEIVNGHVLQDMIDNFLKTVKNIHSISLLQKKSASTTGVEILCRRLTFKILIMFAVPIPVEASAQIAIRHVNVLHLEEKTAGNEYLPSKYPSARNFAPKFQALAMTHRLDFPGNHFRKFLSAIETNLRMIQ